MTDEVNNAEMAELSDGGEKAAKLAAFNATRGLIGRRVIEADTNRLIDQLAHDLMRLAFNAVNRFGDVHLALSGGSTPQALYQRLMIDPRFRTFPWRAAHIWMVDDRCVPEDDDRSNYKLIREMIGDHADVPRSHVHAMPVLEAAGDERYEQAIRKALRAGDRDGRLDFALLGMGADGHTASLFPMTPALDETERWIVFNDGESVAAPRPRMTMTFTILNAARQIAVLVTGPSKRAMIQRISLGDCDVRHLPVTGVRPADPQQQLTWYLDLAAAVEVGGDKA